MEITTTIEEAKATLALEGKLTVQTAPELEAELDTLGPDVANIDIDLTDVDYIASAGLRVFVAIQKNMTVRNGEFRLLNPNDDVNEVFEMTGLSDVLTIVKE